MASGPASRTPRIDYTLLCIGLGLVLGWLPWLIHGPIPDKFNVLYIQGSVAVWGWYLARMSIGLWVGLTVWPRPWLLRGPLCGVLAILPLGIVSIAVPDCGWPWMAYNTTTGAVVGALVGGLAFAITGLHHRTSPTGPSGSE